MRRGAAWPKSRHDRLRGQVAPSAVGAHMSDNRRQEAISPPGRIVRCALRALGLASLVALAVALAPNSASAQLICGVSTTGAETQTGAGATATGVNATACGDASNASGVSSTALGTNSTASALNATATGFDAQATGISSTATGVVAHAFGLNS